MPTPPSDDANQHFERFVAEFLPAYWREHPSQGIGMGYYAHAADLEVFDAARREQRRAFLAGALDQLARFDATALSSANRADLAVLRGALESSLWHLTTFRSFTWKPSSYNVAEPFSILLETEYAPLDTRLRTVLARLEKVPAYYAVARASITDPTLEHTELAIEQNRGALSVFGDDLLARVDSSGLDSADKTLFRQRVMAARTAITDYIAYLTDLASKLAKGGARSFRIGSQLYAQKFAHDIAVGLTAEELYQRALAEKARLHDRMAALARELWPRYMGKAAPPADRLAMIAAVIAELSKHHIARGDLVATVRKQIPELEAFVRDKHLLAQDPSRPLVVRETPPYKRGVAGASVDSPGPYDPQANTYYNVTPLDDYSAERAESYLREYNHWMLQILDIHEAVPGHYTQLMHANKSRSLVKSIFGNDAMVEGWAVYGERMMLEAGYGDNAPEMWLLWMKWNLRTVCNTILDYQVHNQNMTREQVIDLLEREAFQEKAEASEKWRRATLTAVQLTSYFAGYSVIWQFREEEQDRLGAAFDLEKFHNHFLSYGSIPVPIIQTLMREDR